MLYLSGSLTGNAYLGEWKTSRTLGSKYYEMTDHLGNVLATVLDRKTGAGTKPSDPSLYDHWSADLASTADYYPGGMMMPGRNTEYSWSRMGAQKQQKDDEIYGKGNVYAYKYRMEDARINRFFSPDPLHGKYPHNSDYAFSENRLTDGVEFEGLEFASFTLNNNLTNLLYRGQAWLDKSHAEGIKNYEVGKAAQQQAISQGRTNGDGITNTTLALVYLAPFWNSVAPLSDANDGAVLMKGQNLDGSPASKIDFTLAALGAGIPFVSGSALKEIFKVSSKELTVAKYNYKHVAANIPWNKVVEGTRNGPAKFKREINVEKITKEAWDNGKEVGNGKTWKVYEAPNVVGAKAGEETRYIRVELSPNSGELHGHPITKQEFKKLNKSGE